LIGAGCFTDNDAGSAGSTGRGEANILVSGGQLTVEFMRQGKHPRDACLMTLERIAKTTRETRLLAAPGRPNFDISFYAVNKAGQYGAAVMYAFGSTGRRRQFAVADASGARKEDAAYLFERR
jgi:N4-(beta-N-acetylglucosaminyl)-L-asparaginase